MKYFICVIGMVMVVEGLPYMTYPDWTKERLRKLLELPDVTLRIVGLIAVSVGLILLFLGTRQPY